jgi:1,4-alpha-glucan branching enzyme
MITKKASPKGKTVRVTFELPADIATDSVAVVGDFNEWNLQKDQMKLNAKKGVWTKAISLQPDNTYQFRYLVDGDTWTNDAEADGFQPTPYFSENCVLEV